MVCYNMMCITVYLKVALLVAINKMDCLCSGFSEIEQEDQIRLIKSGSFEVLLTRFLLLVDPETWEMLDPSHKMRCPR